VFDCLFGVALTLPQAEALFHLLDIAETKTLGFAEFILFTVAVKQIEAKCKKVPAISRVGASGHWLAS
jgi:hypothetical protein